MGLFSWLFKRNKPKNITLGLALGSGGAKGFAELGVIRAFEENGIEFDVVAGTSIGSIIGAFYANGYSSTDMFGLFQSVDFGEIKNLLMMNMDTSGLYNVIDRNIGSVNIEELKKKFMAVATEVDTGDEYVFKNGSVAQAVCASSCYPPFFKPVIIGDKRLIDGAFSNAVPADLVREMGADYIVSVDLSSREQKSGILSKIFPVYKGKVDEPWEKGYKFSNIVLRPDLNGYQSVSFSASNEMYQRGYDVAMGKMAEIKADIEKLKYGKTDK